jgi:dolichyl-phosphate-mannose--protein O-mannosyl transferase
MKRLAMIMMVLMLILVVPAMAFPFEGLIKFIADATGATETVTNTVLNWAGTILILPLLGWIMKKFPWDAWEKQLYVIVFGAAKKLNKMIIGVPLLGILWETYLEGFVIKWVAGLFRLIAVIPLAIAAGFNSEGESLAGK